jgi:TP901 family phage tail tape measure protein
MSKIHEVAQSTVLLNGQQAEAEMKRLSAAADEFRLKKQAAFEQNDHAAILRWDKKLKETRKEMNSLRVETLKVEQVLKNLNGTSFNDIQKAANKLSLEMKKMGQSDPGYNEKSQQMRLLRSRLNELNNEMRGVQIASKGWLYNLGESFNRYAMLVTTVVASLTGLVMAMRAAITAFNDFEERVDNLSSLTGLAGEELDWLSQRAKDLSKATLESGIRVKQSAIEIVDAFTKTGSARPELLKNKVALSKVTEEAIILANASKSALQPAIEGLTMVLNQYNVPASEARRIINALAAGSKAGAGEIPYLTTAFEKAGTVAADAGLSIETMIAAVETLAPRITQPEIAGRSFKGVLLDLQKTADDTNPAIVGLIPALDNLSRKELSVIELTKLFGDENITVAKILLNNVGELRKYEAAVTGTNVAIEQAAINTDNNNAKLAQARNKITLTAIALGEKLAPSFTMSTNMANKLIRAMIVLFDFFSKYGRSIVTLTASIIAYNIAINAGNIILKLHYYWLLMAEKAQKLFNVASKSNPYGLVAAAVAGLITWLTLYTRRTKEAALAQKEFNKFLKGTEDLLNNTRSIDERAGTLDKMNKKQLEQFIDDAQSELDEFEQLEQRKLVAAKEYEDAVRLVDQRISASAKNEAEKRSLYNNKYFTAERDIALRRLTEISQTIDLNKARLTASIAQANTLLSQLPQSASGDDLKAKYEKDLAEWKVQTKSFLDEQRCWLDQYEPQVIDMSKDDLPLADRLKDVERMMELQRLALDKQRVDGKIDQKEYNEQLEDLEMVHLMTLLSMREQLGFDTLDIEQKLMQKRMQLLTDEEKLQQARQNRMIQNFAGFADLGSRAIEDFIGGNNDALREGAKAMIIFGLELLKRQMQLAHAAVIVQSLATPDSVLSFGATGIIRAAAIYALIEAAFAVTKGLVTAGFDAFDSGGFTAGGDWRKPAGIVHQNEFVANHFATANPTVRPVLEMIDLAQRKGTISTMNLPAALAASGIVSNNAITNNMTDPRLVAILSGIERRLSQPATALLVSDEKYLRAHIKALDDFNAFKSNK